MANHTFYDLVNMIHEHDIPALEQALDEGADVNMVDEVDSPGSCSELTGVCRQYGATLLMWAAEYGQVETLQLLINCKASLELKDDVMHA